MFEFGSQKKQSTTQDAYLLLLDLTDCNNINQSTKNVEGRMVLNSGVVMRVAHVSARLCQYIACNPEMLSSDAVLGLIFCLPFQRFFFSLSSYLGYPPIPQHSD
ncbi:hypothetical protein MtrunA17_Chr7g0253341 [Medicago truncatula]|uniref:Uncharacterized protein n=2 Tax=Medicago truncatula TaxID=3880 RepID=A0A396H940_MEDTR|nr:hypothetical protein MtrunA17_Chr7g0253341 [Medicago truncatula]